MRARESGRRSAGVGLAVLVVLAVLPSSAVAAPGDLDPTFSGDGRVTTKLGGRYEAARDVAVQPDGRIVAVGLSASTPLDESPFPPGGFALARYRPDGKVDRSFAKDGTRVDVIRDLSGALAVALQADGRIVVVGWSKKKVGKEVGEAEFTVARYKQRGKLDRTFGIRGKRVGAPPPLPLPDDFGSVAADVVVQPDGKIVVAGYAQGPGGINGFLLRLQPDGGVDRSFSDDGLIVAPTYEYDRLAVQPDGKILAAGPYPCTGCQQGPSGPIDETELALVRYQPDGSPDPSFSDDGIVLIDGDPDNANSEVAAAGLELDPDGDIVVLSSACFTVTGGASCARVLSRHTPEGKLDPAFGQGGLSEVFISGALALQPDGKPLIATTVERDFAIWRFVEDGTSPDPSFGQGGQVTTAFTASSAAAFGAAIQLDGRLVVAGGATSRRKHHPQRFALARYELGGS
jgi:uncharacterized delta-60 repeat protein